MIAQAILFAVETGMIHHIGSRGSVMQLALLRGGSGVMLVGLLAWKTRRSVLKTSQLPLQLLRGFVSVLYLWVSIYSFARLPFADATAISYTQAAYIAAFSILILNERITPVRWIATAIGTVGALLIVKPAILDSNMVYLVALLGTGFNGLAFVLNKYLQRPAGELRTDDYVLCQCCCRPLQPSGVAYHTAARACHLALAVRRVDLRAHRDVRRLRGNKTCKRVEPWALYVPASGYCSYRRYRFVSRNSRPAQYAGRRCHPRELPAHHGAWTARNQGPRSQSGSPKLALLPLPSAASPCVDGVVPQHAHLIGIGLHRRLEALPIGSAHLLQADDLESDAAVAFAQQRLHLK